MNADVFALLREAAPELAGEVKGVAEDKLLSVEQALGIRFPRAYRSFLRCMGESTGSFSFGADTQTTRLFDLLAELEPPEHRVSRYWRVSVERNLYNPVPVDYYLDLTTADGEDADLVHFLDPPEDAGEQPDARRDTFFGRMRFRVFYQYVCPVENGYRGSLSVDQGTRGQQLATIVRSVLEREGFSEFVPYRDELALFLQGDCYVSMRYKSDPSHPRSFIGVEATSRARAGLLVEKLRDHIPGPVLTSLHDPR